MNRIFAIILSALVVLVWELGAGLIGTVMSPEAQEDVSLVSSHSSADQVAPKTDVPKERKRKPSVASEEI